MHTGFLIGSDGNVLSWSGRNGAHEKSSSLGSISPLHALGLKKLADSLKFFSLNIRGNGNMTAKIRMTDGEIAHEVTWEDRMGDETAIPEAVRPLYHSIVETIAELQIQKSNDDKAK